MRRPPARRFPLRNSALPTALLASPRLPMRLRLLVLRQRGLQRRQFPFKRFLPLRHARRFARCAISRRARQCEPRRSGADEFAAVTSFAEARPPSTVRQKIKASAQKMLLLHAKTPRNANPNATANAASSLAVCG